MIKSIIPTPMNPIPKQKGYTLIEILVALMIFSILSVITTMAMKKIFGQYDDLKKNYQSWQNINQVIQNLNEQTQQLIRRPIKANDEHLFPVFIGQPDYVEWTYTHTATQQLKRIAYSCKNQQLIRRQWSVLDPISRNSYHDTVLIKNLQECRFRYLYPNRDIKAMWIPNRYIPSPRGMQLILTWNNQQTIQLWFALPPFIYEIQSQ
jgi:general secretion pathway protein J